MFCIQKMLSLLSKLCFYSLDLPDVEAWFKHETKQRKIMHNCCFLTILNELTFLLYPLGYPLCIKPSA